MRFSATLIAILGCTWSLDARADVGAEDGVTAGAAVGAGGQGAETYSALELQLDALWRGVRIGLAARGVWEGGVFRRSDWSRAAAVITILRTFEASSSFGFDQRGHATGVAAVAAGALGPGHIAHVADGYRASLDDRSRTGARGLLVTREVSLGLEIDDVIAPALVGGEVSLRVTPRWEISAATALDPLAPGSVAIDASGLRGPGKHVASAFELGVARRWDAEQRRLDLGGSVVVEPREGATAVVAGMLALERDTKRFTINADLRGGNGTSGAVFGPLYRVERLGLIDRARGGIAGGLGAVVAGHVGSLSLGVRTRPGLGTLITAAAAAPMSRSIQAAGWIAASREVTAGAAELRVAWGRRLSSSLQLARMYAINVDTDPAGVMMDARASWSVTVWFGASTAGN